MHDIPPFLILFQELLFFIFNQMLSIGSFGRRAQDHYITNMIICIFEVQSKYFDLDSKFIIVIYTHKAIIVPNTNTPPKYGEFTLLSKMTEGQTDMNTVYLALFRKCGYTNVITIFQLKTRNVSMGHRCPRYCQIRINRALSLTKGHNSNN